MSQMLQERAAAQRCAPHRRLVEHHSRVRIRGWDVVRRSSKSPGLWGHGPRPPCPTGRGVNQCKPTSTSCLVCLCSSLPLGTPNPVSRPSRARESYRGGPGVVLYSAGYTPLRVGGGEPQQTLPPKPNSTWERSNEWDEPPEAERSQRASAPRYQTPHSHHQRKVVVASAVLPHLFT